MAKKAKTPANHPKRYSPETLGIVALVCLAVGFVAGVAFAVYRTGNDFSVQPPPPFHDHGDSPAAPDMTSRIEGLVQEVEQNPDDASLWATLGHHYFDAGNQTKAIEAYEKSLALNSENADVWTDLGVMYRRNGQPEKAIEAFDRAISASPNHEVSRFNKGIVLLHDLNDTQGAIAVWEELVGINPLSMAPNGQSVEELIAHFREHAGTASKKK